MKRQEQFSTIDEYISCFPGDVQKKLQDIRQAIHQLVPDASERISYSMPTFYLKGNLVHFAAYEKHIGFYPAPSGIRAFEKEISGYKHAKGSVQFPLDQPLPLELIKKITLFRAAENLNRKK
ncbi:MAG: DUF1801 domain-containing protein [Spirochaetales bacterium]|nr:DUF1801 domain-containing protein [Spirochaetales bacterium]